VGAVVQVAGDVHAADRAKLRVSRIVELDGGIRRRSLATTSFRA